MARCTCLPMPRRGWRDEDEVKRRLEAMRKDTGLTIPDEPLQSVRPSPGALLPVEDRITEQLREDIFPEQIQQQMPLLPLWGHPNTLTLAVDSAGRGALRE